MTRNEKNKTRWITLRFIERHCNIEKTCQVCGKENTEIHHVDYTNPYHINLLCKQCHAKLHKNEIGQQTIIDIKSLPYYDESRPVAIKAEPDTTIVSPWGNFGATLKQHRTANGLSIRKLANISGLAKSAINYLEHGQRLPSAKTIKTLANALNMPYQSLLDGLMVDYQQALTEDE